MLGNGLNLWESTFLGIYLILILIGFAEQRYSKLGSQQKPILFNSMTPVPRDMKYTRSNLHHSSRKKIPDLYTLTKATWRSFARHWITPLPYSKSNVCTAMERWMQGGEKGDAVPLITSEWVITLSYVLFSPLLSLVYMTAISDKPCLWRFGLYGMC